MADEPKPPAGGLTPAGGVRPASRIVGPIAPPVYTAGAKPGSVRIVAETAEPLVTEGMKARQRDIEKKRRVVATLRAVEDEVVAERDEDAHEPEDPRTAASPTLGHHLVL